jgi:DNA-binding NarL/FixJ family response regulator
MIKGEKDGIQISELIQAKKRIPFIYLTSLSDRPTLERAKKTLPYGYIVKRIGEPASQKEKPRNLNFMT